MWPSLFITRVGRGLVLCCQSSNSQVQIIGGCLTTAGYINKPPPPPPPPTRAPAHASGGQVSLHDPDPIPALWHSGSSQRLESAHSDATIGTNARGSALHLHHTPATARRIIQWSMYMTCREDLITPSKQGVMTCAAFLYGHLHGELCPAVHSRCQCREVTTSARHGQTLEIILAVPECVGNWMRELCAGANSAMASPSNVATLEGASALLSLNDS